MVIGVVHAKMTVNIQLWLREAKFGALAATTSTEVLILYVSAGVLRTGQEKDRYVDHRRLNKVKIATDESDAMFQACACTFEYRQRNGTHTTFLLDSSSPVVTL